MNLDDESRRGLRGLPWALRTVAACLAFTACATPKEVAPRPLPFHLAVIPIEEADLSRIPVSGAEGLTAMRFRPDPPTVSGELVGALDGGAFTRATLLAPEKEQEPGLEGAGEVDWVERARQVGADLILECDLEYVSEVRQQANGNFWLNLTLFAFGGPFTYFVKDRTYHLEIKLRGRFFDLCAIDGEDVLFRDPRAQVLSTTASFTEEDLNFLQRAGRRGDKFLLSILVPSGFLAKEGEALERKLGEIAVRSLGEAFAESVFAEREEFLRPEYFDAFYLDPEDVAIEPVAEGRVRVSGVAHLERKALVERMDRWRIIAGLRAAEGTFNRASEPEGDSSFGYTSYSFRAEVELESGIDTVRLQLAAGTRDRFVRSYTFPLE